MWVATSLGPRASLINTSIHLAVLLVCPDVSSHTVNWYKCQHGCHHCHPCAPQTLGQINLPALTRTASS